MWVQLCTFKARYLFLFQCSEFQKKKKKRLLGQIIAICQLHKAISSIADNNQLKPNYQPVIVSFMTKLSCSQLSMWQKLFTAKMLAAKMTVAKMLKYWTWQKRHMFFSLALLSGTYGYHPRIPYLWSLCKKPWGFHQTPIITFYQYRTACLFLIMCPVSPSLCSSYSRSDLYLRLLRKLCKCVIWGLGKWPFFSSLIITATLRFKGFVL